MTGSVRQHALITGATSGFGYEFSKLFAGARYNLILVARSQEQLHRVAAELAEKYHVEVRVIAEDLFDAGAAERIHDQTKSWGVPVDVLINDAGQGEHGPFAEYDLARDIDIIQLNITALVSLTKLYLRDMLARGSGRILQVSSLLARYPTPLMAVYAGTKAFVLSFTEALINELKDSHVTMTALLPGAADTDFFHKAGAEHSVTYRETTLSAPGDVAKDGFGALMRGESRIISGAKSKTQAGMSNIMPDHALAATMRKQMDPSDKAKGRDEITHPASREERQRINETTGRSSGDYEEHFGHQHKE